jgi:hypothetical protein
MNDQQTNRDFSAQRASFPGPQITSCANGYLRPLWPLSAPLYMSTGISPLRRPPRGRPGIRNRAIAQLRDWDHWGRSALPSYVRARNSFPLRLWLRAWLRPSLPPSLHGSTRPKGDQSPPQRRLRAWRFADIPSAPPGQNINAVLVITLSIFSASLALDACANTSALVRQRFCITSATGIASVPATPEPQTIITGSALASQHFAVNRSQARRSA